MAVVGMLALSSPGVRVARAGDGDAASTELPAKRVWSRTEIRACKVPDQSKPPATATGVSAAIAERIRAEMQSSDEKPVVLNGRGYNYGSVRDPQLELRIVEAEAARQRERASSGR